MQPQWVFDSVNCAALQPVADYFPGVVLPPHLSPFVTEAEGDYVPPERRRALDKEKGVDSGEPWSSVCVKIHVKDRSSHVVRSHGEQRRTGVNLVVFGPSTQDERVFPNKTAHGQRRLPCSADSSAHHEIAIKLRSSNQQASRKSVRQARNRAMKRSKEKRKKEKRRKKTTRMKKTVKKKVKDVCDRQKISPFF